MIEQIVFVALEWSFDECVQAQRLDIKQGLGTALPQKPIRRYLRTNNGLS